jgi:ankyrin repeat protein
LNYHAPAGMVLRRTTDVPKEATMTTPSAWDSYRETMIAKPTLLGAAKDNDVAALAQLLDRGADIDARDHRGYSALMLATYTGNQEAFDLLLARGADPDTADNAGNSALMGAAFKGHLAMVRRLLEAGADRSARNHAGLDALGFATQFGRSEIVQFLQPQAERLP